MSSYDGYPSHSYNPSAPPLPPGSSAASAPPPPPPSALAQPPMHPSPTAFPYQPPPPPFSHQHPPPPAPYGYAPSPSFHGGGGSGGFGYFPPGTHPEIIRSFQAVDQDGSGSIDEAELQAALSAGYQKFSSRTVRLLMFLFKNPKSPSKIGPAEFASLWSCLGEWRAIFERFDRDRSGKIDSSELRDALLSIGYAVPPSVLQVLVSKYNDGKTGKGALSFDSFVECGMVVKGLTEKFKEKDPRYTGSATLSYEEFMKMIIPFLVA
ncbi:probable calcium-binding protein CML48 [Dioscorea cayenensis subsp. rotundata]|uniref:Probable calcium-binding protein CML48 n=1 Tax=Dioscorea cayennensis subsp. rotundata TaxID=55577 RepID=A0AB40CGY5_DIOCR|nr:probable calcium-binding protein CML48 [Dioscorea cayenensis subsp. rotundata]